MNDIIWLIIELLMIILIPTIIPFFIIMLVGNLNYNERIKRILMFLSSLMYNGIIGIISPLIFFCMYFLIDPNIILWIICLVIVFGLILLPLNIFMKKKGKINIFLYLVINVAIFILGIYIYIINVRGHFGL